VSKADTLIVRARLIGPAEKSKRGTNQSEELELALAFAKGEVRRSQVAAVLEIGGSSVDGWAKSVLFRAARHGDLVIKGAL